MRENYKDTVQIFKALADNTRLEIIDVLSGGELCACKILENFNITQPTLSYHMKILIECGLVIGNRDGTWMRYSLKEYAFEELDDLLNDFYTSIKQDLSINCYK